LCAIAAPSSLVGISSNSVSTETCTDVPSLNFSRDNGPVKGWPSRGDTEICYWGYETTTKTWYYDMPSYEFSKTAAVWFASEAPIPPRNPCPVGTNCTYSISFDAVAFKCDEEADFDGTSGQSLDELAPTGNVLYSCSSIKKEGRVDEFGVPTEWHNISKNDTSYGTFTKLWPMWIGYVRNTTRPAANQTLWTHELERKVLKCTLNYATYNYAFSSENGRPVANRSRIDYHGPLLQHNQSVSPQDPMYRQYAYVRVFS